MAAKTKKVKALEATIEQLDIERHYWKTRYYEKNKVIGRLERDKKSLKRTLGQIKRAAGVVTTVIMSYLAYLFTPVVFSYKEIPNVSTQIALTFWWLSILGLICGAIIGLYVFIKGE